MLLPDAPSYRFDDFDVRPGARVLERAGVRVTVGAKSFDLLVCLVAHAGEVVSREQLMKAAWPDSFVEETNLAQHIFSLRRALGDRAGCIVTVPGRGYQFTAEVRRTELESLEPPSEVVVTLQTTTRIVTEEFVAVPPVASKPRARLWLWAGIAAVLLGMVAAAAWWETRREVPGDHHEVVLAAFDNATGDPQFDGTLNAALAIDLEESPYLAIAGNTKVRATLQLMERPPDERVAGAAAREVCQRLNDQAVLSGRIGRLGRTYLVTLTAADCATGQELVRTRAVARGVDEVLAAVDTAAAQMRRRLGEPLKTLRRFDTPLKDKMTHSLEALKAYSQARTLMNAGKNAEALPLLRQAVALDPTFAVAYLELGGAYFHQGEYTLGIAADRKSYEVRDHATERDRVMIGVQHVILTSDAETIMTAMRSWADMYPNDVRPAVSLANGYVTMAEYERALGPGRRAVQLDPDNGVAYEILTEALMQSGHVDEARTVAQRAVAKKLDGPEVHGYLAALAFLNRDWAEVDRQVAWGKGTKSEPYMMLMAAEADDGRGKAKAEEAMYWRLAEAYRAQGMRELSERTLPRLPRDLAEMGLIDEARAVLKRIAAADNTSTDYTVALAETGEVARAEKDAATMERENPLDTIYIENRVPQMRAAAALYRKRPEQAIAALAPATPLEMRELDVPPMRGLAYLAARQPAQAAVEFRKVVDHASIEPFSANIPLAHLGLARAAAMQGDVAGARREYGVFLELWKDADADLPPVKAARAELAGLGR